MTALASAISCLTEANEWTLRCDGIKKAHQSERNSAPAEGLGYCLRSLDRGIVAV